MKLIRKYLESINKQLVLIDTDILFHHGGRSFYNDGTYEVDVYQLIGTTFKLKSKVTGRKEYTLYNGDELVGMKFNQRMFIEEVLKKFIQ